MATPARQTTTAAFWPGGLDSQLSPALLPKDKYQYAFNVTCRGGIIQTRPRYKLTLPITGVRPQMLTLFTPTGELPSLVLVCDGLIYTSPFPFTTLTVLKDAENPTQPIRLDANAPQCFSAKGIKTVQQQGDGSLTLIDPKQLLFISDGRSRGVVWDGLNLPKHSNPGAPEFGTPGAVGPMCFSNSRMWVALGNRLYASDIQDPGTYTETQVLAEGGFFAFDLPITALVETTDQKAMLVFTATATYAVLTSQRDRTTWQKTPGFVQKLLPGIGCVAAKSTVNQFGTTWFYSAGGLISLDSALNTYRTSAVVYQDQPMERSKLNLSFDKSGVCVAVHEDYFLCSVPSGGTHNRHTWVLDTQPMTGAPQAWPSIWTGTQPVEYATGVIQGKLRTFFLSLDPRATDGSSVHVWEAFAADIADPVEPAGPVYASMQTGCFLLSGYEPSNFVAAEFMLVGLEGNVHVKISVAGNAGGYLTVFEKDLIAPRGPYGPGWVSDPAVPMSSYRPQARIIRTEEFDGHAYGQNVIPVTAETSNRQENEFAAPLRLQRHFSFLVEITGVGGVQVVRVFQDQETSQIDATVRKAETTGTSLPIDVSDYQIEKDYFSL